MSASLSDKFKLTATRSLMEDSEKEEQTKPAVAAAVSVPLDADDEVTELQKSEFKSSHPKGKRLPPELRGRVCETASQNALDALRSMRVNTKNNQPHAPTVSVVIHAEHTHVCPDKSRKSFTALTFDLSVPAKAPPIEARHVFQIFADHFKTKGIPSYYNDETPTMEQPEPYFITHRVNLLCKVLSCCIDEVGLDATGTLCVHSVVLPGNDKKTIFTISRGDAVYVFPSATGGHLQLYLLTRLIPRLMEDSFNGTSCDKTQEMTYLVMLELTISKITVKIKDRADVVMDLEDYFKKTAEMRTRTEQLRAKLAAAEAVKTAAAKASEESVLTAFAKRRYNHTVKPKPKGDTVPVPVPALVHVKPRKPDVAAKAVTSAAATAAAAPLKPSAGSKVRLALLLEEKTNDQPKEKTKNKTEEKKIKQPTKKNDELYNPSEPETEESDGEYVPKSDDEDADTGKDDTDTEDISDADGKDERPKKRHDSDDTDDEESGPEEEDPDTKKKKTKKCPGCNKNTISPKESACLFCMSKCVLCKKVVNDLETEAANWPLIKRGVAHRIICKDAHEP